MFDDENQDKSFDDIEKMPIFIKAFEIMHVAHNLVEFLSEIAEDKLDEEELNLARQMSALIFENASLIPAKISGAERVEIYDLKMENAALIRKAARELSTHCSAMTMFDLGADHYLEMIHDEIDELRVLFAQWVMTFDPWNYHIDRWGLFNPPGVNFDDPDPDDDLPYDGNAQG